jgi:hypothetical protein
VSIVGVRYFFLLALAVVPFVSTAAGADNHQRPILAEQPERPRFELRDRDWPGKVGEASVCLWKDDALAACSITIDDNTAPDHAWWQEMSKKCGLRVTWFIVTGSVGTPWGGTWEGWQRLHAQGHDVQSHTVNHLRTASPSWKGIEAEYTESIRQIETAMPGNRVLVLAYPGGEDQDKLNDPKLAAEHYIGCRGGAGLINPANRIDYVRTNSIGMLHVDDPKTPWADMQALFRNNVRRDSSYRGWYCAHYHQVRPEVREQEEKKLAFVHQRVQSNDLWLGLFREVVQYGQQRDTAHLEVKSAAADKIVLSLVDEMDDTRFDFPLTVKVRVDPSWKAVRAEQGGRVVEARVLERIFPGLFSVKCWSESG